MQKQEKRLSKRVRKLVIICFLTAIILTVATYAWFIGMRSVKVSPFDVEIAAAESLSLSLDGAKWSDVINISKATLNDVSYEGHTNSWGGKGLIPMSSIGEMDSTVSRMKLFEKASLTPTDGGYRLMASRVNNYHTKTVGDAEVLEGEPDGYVVFDLFIRNFSGTQYITALNEPDEEAIYLTTDSKVVVAADGVEDTGIENSVRVAFAQIGRVIGTTTAANADKITGITCSDDNVNGVTGICRTAQIWEPNDKAHVDDAISWYDTSCLAKTVTTIESRCKAACGAEDTSCPTTCEGVTTTCNTACDAETDPALKKACLRACVGAEVSYSGDCSTVADNNTYATYAVNNDIESADQVDVYDGEVYNKYTGATLLTAYPYFTDTMKNKYGTQRPLFMTFAPNSITKVRVYIYIEGQDVDNYDFAAIGKKISVTFGFTKERFTPEDIQYDGPLLPTTLGTCTGGTAPTTEAACTAARGLWTVTGGSGENTTGTCATNGTKEYCDLTRGTFDAAGDCTGGDAIDNATDCGTAGGTWDEGTSTCAPVRTASYCTAVNGTFTPDIKQSDR